MQEGQQFGPYQLIKRIAFGGMAEIHLAKTTGIGGFEKLLALKVIHPKFSADQEFIDMLVDEAKIAVQLSHVNIGQIFDLGQIDGVYFIAMEFIDGKDLYQLLVKCSELDIQIPYDIISFIGIETSAGLQYAHTKSDNYGRPLNLIHRDISPQNILISYDGEIKIVDFGIAKASQRSRETESGVIKGKFFYMSPEQAWGDDLDARSDIFSTGICLYEMITGEMLYNEDKALALLDMVRRAEIPDMRTRRHDLPADLDRVTRVALAREKEDRYQSAGALQGALSGFLYGNWPNFNRRRLADFMKQVFGDNRFVLPMPQAEQPRPAVQERAIPSLSSSNLMGGDDYDAPMESVIFNLGAAEAQRYDDPQPQLAEEDRTVASIYDGGIEPDYLDEAEDERTIAEPVWASTDMPEDDEDKTITISSMPGASDFNAAEPPTNMYDAARLAQGMPAPQAAPPGAMERTRAMMSPAAAANPMPAQAPAEMESTRALMSPGRAMPQPAQAPSGMESTQALPSPGRANPFPTAAPPGSNPAAPISRPGAAAPTPLAPPPSAGPAPVHSRPPQPASPMSSGPKPANAPVRTHTSMPSLMPKANAPTIHAARKPKGPSAVGKLVKRIASPVGISIIVVVLLLIYGAFAFLPTLFSEPPPREATLVVQSVPEGAQIFLDDTDTGKVTPGSLEKLSPGQTYTLKLVLRGYTPQIDEVTIGEDELSDDGPTELSRRFFLRKAQGLVRIISEPSGAEVYHKGKYLGDTPLESKDFDSADGPSTVTLRKEGFRDTPAEVKWGDDPEVTVKVTLQKRDP